MLLRYGHDDLVIEVDDDGTGGGADGGRGSAAGSSNGLTGMAEQARALGGSFDAGPRPGGGARVSPRCSAPRTTSASSGGR
ncbi:MAG TPA: hypothetical protein VHT26_21405 [Trebonia sp.]|nr:hypothetical protein [Trebonia sp.]